MGNPRQKKKLRSSFPKAVQKPKKTNTKILGNALIAANWDHKQTLTQNYRRLGLAHRLRRAAGGTEDKIKVGVDVNSKKVPGQQSVEGTREVRIRRDGQGRVLVDDEHGNEELGAKRKEGKKKESVWGSLEDPMNSDSEDSNSSELDFDSDTTPQDDDRDSQPNHTRAADFLTSHAATGHLGSQWTDTDTATADSSIPAAADLAPHVLSQLTKSAKIASRERAQNKPSRTPSAREQAWIAALVAKHGEDYGAMARDAKLNLRQQSVGDIRRRVKGWVGTNGWK